MIPDLGRMGGIHFVKNMVKHNLISREKYDSLMRKSNVAENVFYRTLRTKSAKFSLPFNLQLISFSPVTKNILVSDGRLMKSVTLSSKYDYLFELSLISPNDIVTIYEIDRSGRFDLFVGNLKIQKEYQVNCKIGNPTMFNV